MARPLLLSALLLAAVWAGGAASPAPALQLNALSVVRGVVLGLTPGSACATVSLELGNDVAAQQAVACAEEGTSGGAAFAMRLARPTRVRIGRLVVRQPGAAPGVPDRVWQQFLDADSMAALRVNMVDAREEAAAPATAADAAPTSAAAPTAEPALPVVPACACPPRRTCTELEDAGNRSLPTLLALALRMPAPKCPTPDAKPTAATAARRPLLLPGLAATCAAQAGLLAALLAALALRRRAAQPAAGAAAALAEPAAPRRPSLRDACTSPLALLASPFVGRRQVSFALEAIQEEERDADDTAAAQQATRQGDRRASGVGQQLGAAGIGVAASSGLPPPPAGWTRDAWGRLQRQSGSGWGGKPAQMHPAPFGAAPGAYRSAYQAGSEE